MRVVRGIDKFVSERPVVLTQGTFDGVHLGHQKILTQVVERALEMGGESVLLTFFPHPRLVLYPDSTGLKLITTLDEKRKILEDLGIDTLIVQAFDKSLSRYDPISYIEDVLVKKIGVKEMIIGYDHRFGKNREGSIEDLRLQSQKWKYKVSEIARHDIDAIGVSSTKIRNYLDYGNVQAANALLGRRFSFTGRVIRGHGVGKKIGFPTANILIEETYKILPKEGVYAGVVKVGDQRFCGMLNIGGRPTFDDHVKNVEVHILDFNGDLYGETVEVACVERIRDTVRFEDSDALIKQLKTDKESIIQLCT
jgi:riboflavin kinase/FMN adenylyltransferase